MSDAELLAAKLGSIEEINEPWPHGIIDDFLPSWAWDEVRHTIGAMNVSGDYVKAKPPESVLALFRDEVVLSAIRERYGFGETKGDAIDLVYSRRHVEPHSDRVDKPWSGIVYLAGDPKGTDLYSTDGKFHSSIGWKPNRMACWSGRLPREQHAVPKSAGRYVLRWWLLKNKASTGAY